MDYLTHKQFLHSTACRRSLKDVCPRLSHRSADAVLRSIVERCMDCFPSDAGCLFELLIGLQMLQFDPGPAFIQVCVCRYNESST